MKKRLLLFSLSFIIPASITSAAILVLTNKKTKTINEDLSNIQYIDKIIQKTDFKERTIIIPENHSSNFSDEKNKKFISDEIKKIISLKELNSKKVDIELDINNTKKEVYITLKKGEDKKKSFVTFYLEKIESSNKAKLDKIINKINIKDLFILKDVDVSSDKLILQAIKNELKKQNPKLIDKDLENITDNIISLTPGVKTNVDLTFKIGTGATSVNTVLKIRIFKAKSDIDKISEILNKINTNKNIIIDKAKTNASDFILDHLKNINNLSIEEISAITFDKSKLTTFVNNEYQNNITANIKLNIILGKEKRTIIVNLIKNDSFLFNEIKTKMNKLQNKDIVLPSNVNGNITDNKKLILDTFKKISNVSNILNNLNGMNISIKNSSNLITKESNFISILLSKKSFKGEIDNIFKVKRVLNESEQVKIIKDKIKDKNILLNKAVNVENDDSILEAIKNQLKIQNDELTSEDLAKITDNINSLTSGVNTSVILTITIGSITDTINVNVLKYRTISEIKNAKLKQIENKIKIKKLILKENALISTDNEILAAIKAQLKIDNPTLTNTEIELISDNITSLTPGIEKNVDLTFTIDAQNLLTINIVLIKPLTDSQKVAFIKSKIKNKNLTILKNVDTSNDAKILQAIKNQLKAENTTLTNEDLLTITDNIDSLIPETNKKVTLTITVGKETDTIGNITINKPLSDIESIETAKNAINNLSVKTFTISATSGDITANKNAIKTGLEALSGYPTDLKGTTISIEDSSTNLTLEGIEFTIVITKEKNIEKIISGFFVKRSKTAIEINKSKVATIKAKIQSTNLTIDKDVDTSDDAKILAAIKAQLKIDNSTLTNQDLAKITDNISSLVVGTDNSATLTITVNKETDTVDIKINRPLNDTESVEFAKNAINSLSVKTFTISATSGNITANKIAILAGLQNLSGYSNIDLKGTTISIEDSNTSITLVGIEFTIMIKKGSIIQKITTGFKVKKSKTIIEIETELVSTIKSKIQDTNLNLDNNADISNNDALLIAIKNQLKSENTTLSNDDLAKITDNISSLTIDSNNNNVYKTNAILTITVGSTTDTISITINKNRSQKDINMELIKAIKLKISNTNLSIAKNVDISNDAAILVAIKAQLKIDNSTLSNSDLAKITDNISSLITGEKANVTLTITIGSQSDTVDITLLSPLNDSQIVAKIKNKISINGILILDKLADISNDAAILVAIKKELKSINNNLTNEDLLKISDNISILQIGTITDVTLTITSNNVSDTKEIQIIKQYTDDIAINEIKSKLENLTNKQIQLPYKSTNGTILDNKQNIKNAILRLQNFPSELLNVDIAIENSNTQISFGYETFIVTLTKGNITKKINSGFQVRKDLDKKIFDTIVDNFNDTTINMIIRSHNGVNNTKLSWAKSYLKQYCVVWGGPTNPNIRTEYIKLHGKTNIKADSNFWKYIPELEVIQIPNKNSGYGVYWLTGHQGRAQKAKVKITSGKYSKIIDLTVKGIAK